ncbi:MAG: discoidin domain-containing protein [Deltaproteobacteria bacterium]|nr:discoidin domain-containing protein [Deltaproteobacteria bacterium]
MWRWAVGTVLALAWLAPGTACAAGQVLDEFENVQGWSAQASPGASLEIAQDAGRTGNAMRLDFDFRGGGGFVIARKAFPITLPGNFAFTFDVRGDAPPNTLEFKLIEPANDNVWWRVHRDWVFRKEWQHVVVKKSRLEYAWGQKRPASPKKVAFVEIAITTGEGGKGSVWIDDLRLEERATPSRADLPPVVTASTFAPGHEPRLVLDQDPQTSWRSGELAAEQWLQLDFGKPREYGGLVVDWDPEHYATTYRVEVSDDAEAWTVAYASTAGSGGRSYVYLPDGESRYLRLALAQSSQGKGYEIRSLAVQPIAFSTSPNQFFEAVAAGAFRGTYPKYFTGRQSYWTVVGARDDDHEALVSEEGIVEVDKGAFTIEPFLYVDGALVTWSDAQPTQALADRALPIPSVTWRQGDLRLRIETFVGGPAGASVLYLRYDLENLGGRVRDVDLFLALRPFQVLPPWQSLNMVGGVTPIRSLTLDGRTVWVNGERAVVSLTAPDRFGGATFEQGLVGPYLLKGKVPPDTNVADQLGWASGALAYRLTVAPDTPGVVALAVPFHDPGPAIARAATMTVADLDAERTRVAREWTEQTSRVEVTLPEETRGLVDTLRSMIAHILINRDGSAIQPGSRTYARSWIRDGALTSDVLLKTGHVEEVRRFLTWYAPYQLPDGRVPCCVDRRGADPVPEHDSNGELIYAIAEYYRFTRDIGFVHALWPVVTRAVDWIANARATRMTDAYREPGRQVFFGLLPESISHEGYSSHPVHSYWDDFFALRGVADAAALARVVGDSERAASFAALRDAFRTDIVASIKRVMETRTTDYLPASVELADFDPTSSAIAITIADLASDLPRAAIDRTFERYWDTVADRLAGRGASSGYSPYELRNVEAMVRLGHRERAYEILDALLRDQRPPAWNQWAEIVWRDPNAPRFIGDMPHTWVGSSYVRALRTMLAYERERDQALVVAAGVPSNWLAAPGVGVKRLPTYWGVLSYTLGTDGPRALVLHLDGDLTVPAGGLVLQPPLAGPLTRVTVNGAPVEGFGAQEVTLRALPADVRLEF